MKSIIKFAVDYPVTILMFILGVILLGVISLDKLGVDLFPDLNNPAIYVEIEAGERPPGEMEDQFVDRVEAMAIRQSDVVNVTSVSKVGNAQVVVEYSWGKDMDEAYLELQKALASFNQLDGLEALNITQHDPNSAPVMIIAMEHNEITDLNELRKVAENYIRNELIRIEGIAEVELSGQQTYEVIISTDESQLNAYGVTMDEIASRIANYNQNISGGSVVEMGRKYVVKGVSELNQIEDLRNIILRVDVPTEENELTDRVALSLGDIATLSYEAKEPDNIIRLNGKRCIGLSVYKETRYNTVKSVEQLQEGMKSIEAALPGYSFTVVQNQGKFIDSAIGEVEESALYGIILAVFILLIFLRRFSTTLIVSLSIPISIIATFTLMYFNDITLNIMSLGGLALGAGMLVDNAIVVMENIFRNHENGESARNSAIKGTAQVGGAIIASTLTTIVVFLPIVYLQGASGALFKEQALTVTFSLLSSLVVAILVIPMFYAWFTGRKRKVEPKPVKSIQIKGYGNFVYKVLQYRWLVIGIATLLLIAGYFMAKSMGSEFMPRSESREFLVDVKLPEGTHLNNTDEAALSVEDIIEQMAGDDLEFVYAQIGPVSGLTDNSQSIFIDQNTATLKVALKKGSKYSAGQYMAALSKQYEESGEVKLAVRQEETALQNILGTNEAPVVVELIGEEYEDLEVLTADVLPYIYEVNGLLNIATSIEGGAPEVVVQIDRFRAGMLNVDVTTVVNAISEKLTGTEAGTMEVDGELNDIYIKVRELKLSELENLKIVANGAEVPLREIANVSIEEAPKQILHNNQNRVIKITASMAEGIALDQMSERIEEALAKVTFPPKYKYQITGEEQMRKESMENLSFALMLSLILVYMVLASQFESLKHPFTILLTVPLAVVGGLAVFFFAGKALNMMAFIGIIMLVGIAVNDSIILVDAINQNKKQGMKLRDAIAAAGQQRIRPIIMTTLTTILALLPLTFGFGESASLRSPMAWAVIGGLVTSTLLTLAVIPAVYYVIDGVWNSGKKEEDKTEIAPVN